MQISDTSSIARLIPARVPQHLKTPQANTPQPQANTPQPTPQSVPRVTPTAISSPPVPDLGINPTPETMKGHQTPADPLQALMADWGKTDSPHDLDGDGTVGIQDMLLLLKQMAESPIEEPIDPMQALLDDWGKTDSPHDLNGDGTVGIQDMLQLLGEMATGHDDSAGDVQSQSDRLKALMDDWGKSDSIHDLDGDGTVGINDMLQLLNQMAAEVVQPAGGDPGSDTPGKTRLQQLLDDWGKAGSKFDLNADGTVGINDMLMLLAQLAGREPESAKATGFDARNPAVTYHRASAHNIARALMPQVASMDPGEVRESIQASNIPAAQKRFVLDQIAAWYPRAVSVVG